MLRSIVPIIKVGDVTVLIVKTLITKEPNVDFMKDTAQTYNEAKNIQGLLAVVQMVIKDNHYHFAANLNNNNNI